MNKIKILCTGGGGFLMSNFIRKLLKETSNYSIISIDAVKNTKILNTIYSNKGQTFYIGNTKDSHFINTVFEIEKPDIVIHAAEEKIGKTNCTNQDMINTNILGTQILLDATIKYNSRKFIYISTDKVYGTLNSESETKPTEDSIINPLDIYSSTKAASELLIKTNNKINYNILRISNCYGPRQPREYLITKIIANILENKTVELHGQGNQVRDHLHVQDFCSALKLIVEFGVANHMYNIGAGQEFSNVEVFHSICSIMGKGHDLLKFISDKPSNNFRYAINSTKLRTLGWVPEFKLKAGLEHTINFLARNQWILK